MYDTYGHPDKLIGQTLNCHRSHILASMSEQDILSLDSELLEAQKTDPKFYDARGMAKGISGTLSAASSLNWIASGKESSFEIILRYIHAGRLFRVDGDGNKLSVEVIGATRSTEKFPLVHIKVLDGPRAGSLWWMNVNQLDIEK
jgi:hypothetical protein